MRDWSLLDGIVPGTAAMIGAIALVFLLARTGRSWWLAKVPIYPTVGALVGTTKPELTAFAAVPGGRPKTIAPAEGRSLEQVWNPPANLPSQGTVSMVPIPGTVSGFHARDAELYLPPAYAAEVRPLLPVLVLLPGQPGGPADWFGAGQVATAMDGFAARHHGLAPVVVAADPNGSTFGNTMCTDSSRGNAGTYLTQDVPAWIKANLQITTDSAGWGVGGYSYGGTCALQLAVRAPAVYQSFIDISGESEPTLDILRATPPLEVAGYLAVGDHDAVYRPEQQAVRDACERAGLPVDYRELPGAHSWGVWRPALVAALPWYAHRSGLIQQARYWC